MKPWISALLSLLFASRLWGDTLLREAETAYRAGLPEVTISKLERLFSGAYQASEDRPAHVLYAKSLIEIGRPDSALNVLNDLAAAQQSDPEIDELVAQASLRLGHWSHAAELFARLLEQIPVSSQTEARLGLASAQRALHQRDAAELTLKPLIGTEPRAALLAAEMRLQASNPKAARSILENIGNASPELRLARDSLWGECDLQEKHLDDASQKFKAVLASPVTGAVRARTLAELGLAKIALLQQEPEEAEELIEKIIGNNPNSPVLAELFENLYTVYSQETNPQLNEFVSWSSDASGAAERQGFARYYLARLQSKQNLPDKAIALLHLILTEQPRHPIAQDAAVALADLLVRNGNARQAISALEKFLPLAALDPKNLPPPLGFALARAHFAIGNYPVAHQIFAHVDAGNNEDIRSRVLFNSALCSLQAGDFSGFSSEFARLKENPHSTSLTGTLLFDRALLEARNGQARADQTLLQFLREFPADSKIPDARLILAELRLTEQPADPSAAKAQLSQVKTLDPSLQEKADRLSFTLAVNDPKQKPAVAEQLAKDFLQKYPQSQFRTEVHLKLGEFFFRQNDFANAQTQFELVREEDPDSPLLEPALFLAGEAARKSLNPSSLDNAIGLFEDVYKIGGPLKYQARLEQALTKRQVHQESEAIVLLNDLVSQHPPEEVLREALDALGDAKFTLAGDQPALYQEALDTFERLASLDNLPTHWKQRALYKKAKCYEKQQKLDAALETYYDVLALPANGADQLWFFRAGFEAAQILEDRHSWSSAAAVYEQLANTRGAKSEEAKNRLDRLRLEHFLWPN
jgi:TolA-binding protein